MRSIICVVLCFHAMGIYSQTSAEFDNVGRLPAVMITSSDKIETDNGVRRIMPNAQTKFRMPASGTLFAHHTSMSTSNRYQEIMHPSGSQLFPDNAGLAGMLDSLLSMLKNSDLQLIAYLRKVQFFALRDVFNHLVSIRTTFNMTHPRTKSANPTDLVAQYLNDEKTYSYNKKAAIVENLLNIVQAQLFQITLNYFPTLPASLATLSGTILMEHDFGANLNFLIQEQELAFFGEPEVPAGESVSDVKTKAKQIVHATQAHYLLALKKYNDFLNAFTASLDQQSSKLFSPNKLYDYANTIAPIVNKHFIRVQQQQSASIKANSAEKTAQKITALNASYKPLNPPLFLYNKETLRALLIIPALAKDLPVQTTSLGWPEHLVAAAKSGERAKTKLGESFGYPIAYFKTSQNTITYQESEADGLYIHIPMANDLYEQRVSKQPNWLNSLQGIFRILKGCLGNFKELVGMNILDPCLESIFIKAYRLTDQEIQGKGSADMTGIDEWRLCQIHLSAIAQSQAEFIKKHSGTPTKEKNAEELGLNQGSDNEDIAALVR